MFEYDYCMCGNPDKCPNKESCLRAINLEPGIYTYSLFYSEDKECENYIPKEVN